MITLSETIRMVQESHDSLVGGSYLESAGLTDDQLQPVLYYLKCYKHIVDGLVGALEDALACERGEEDHDRSNG